MQELRRDLDVFHDAAVRRMDLLGSSDADLVAICTHCDRRCDTALIVCENCKSVTWCSAVCKHKSLSETPLHSSPGSHHVAACGALHLYQQCLTVIRDYDLCIGVPPWLPSDFVQLASFPSGWSEYAKARSMPDNDSAWQAVVSSSLSYPLVVAHVLEQHALRLYSPGDPGQECQATADAKVVPTTSHNAQSQQERVVLTIHVLGAAASECNGVEKWRELLLMLPSVNILRICFIGPDVPERMHEEELDFDLSAKADERTAGASLCSPSRLPNLQAGLAGRRLSMVFRRTLYEDYIASVQFVKPHLAMAFNFGANEDPDTWKSAMQYLFSQNVLTAFTSYHLEVQVISLAIHEARSLAASPCRA